MSETFNFRSAFNGFHREDVVRYIEYLNSKHSAEINQLNTQHSAEVDLLNNQLKQITVSADALQLQAHLDAAQEINEQLQARIDELEERLTAPEENPLEARCRELEQQLKEAQKSAAQYDVTRELEAYRRAERTEREARERAEQVYRLANGALADATVKVDDAFTQISELTERVNAQLSQLQEAVTVSRQALSDATESLYSIAPTSN